MRDWIKKIFPFGKDKDLSELLKGGAKSFGVKVLGIVVMFLATIVTTKYYGKEAFGTVVLVLTILRIANIFGRLGIDTAALKYIAIDNISGSHQGIRKTYRAAFFPILFSSVIIGVCLFFFSGIIANKVFKKSEIEIFIQWGACVLPFFSLSFLNAESLRGIKKVGSFTFLNNVSISLISLLALVGMKWVSTELKIPVIIQNAAICITFFVGFLIILKTINPFKGFSFPQKELVNKLLKVGFPLMFSASVIYIMNWASTLILGIYQTSADVGIFNAVLRTANLVSLPLLAINSISAPKFSEKYGHNDMKGLKKIVHNSTKIIFLLTLPPTLLLFVFPDFFLGLFGSDFTIGNTALRFVIIGHLFNALCGSVGYLLQMTGNQRVFQNIVFFSAIINVGLNILLIPSLGIEGAAISSAFSMGMWNILGVIFVFKKLNIFTPFNPFNRGAK